MTIPLKGKLVDVGLLSAVEALIAQPGLNYLRLHGSAIDVRMIHVGRGQCFLNDYTRKVRDRIGERLVRGGFVERSVLVEQLKRQEDDGQRLEFSEYVPNAKLEFVVMNQTLDSLDRLSLFPMLDYEIAPQTTVYRGAKISAKAIEKRLRWIEQNREVFLRWRQRMEEGQLFMPAAVRGITTDNAKISKALSSGSDWSSLQAELQEPLANIALRLEQLAALGHLQYLEAASPAVIKVERARWRVLGFILSLCVLMGAIYYAPPDLTVAELEAEGAWARLSQLARVAETRDAVGFEVEQFRERHRRHPTEHEITQSFADPATGVIDVGELSPYQYIGMPDDFVVISEVSAIVGDDE